MPLTLYIPGLIDATAGAPHASAASLSRLIGDAPADVEPEGAIALLAARYGIARQHDWPLAALRLAALNLDPGSRYWLRATPVHLQATHDDVTLAGAADDLTRDEADALVSTLAAHFAPDGLAFLAPCPDDWYVGSEGSPDLCTESLPVVIGQRLRAHLPRGDDAARWRRWQQEIEMLLHDHPVNVRREQEARTIVNGVWLQHGGRLPARDTSAQVTTWSDHPDLCALAHYIGRPAQSPPEDISQIMRNDDVAVIVSTPRGATLDHIEQAYATVILDALHARRVDRVELIGDGAGRPALRWTCKRRSWLRRVVPQAHTPVTRLVGDALGSS